MIRITCIKCRRTLTMDDAFAGSVCRCQHCGTIQTVPKSSAKVTNAPEKTTRSKELYQKDQPSKSGGTGLDELATAVSGRSKRSAARSETTLPAGKVNPFDRLILYLQKMKKEQPALMIGIIAAICVLLIAVIIAMLF